MSCNQALQFLSVEAFVDIGSTNDHWSTC